MGKLDIYNQMSYDEDDDDDDDESLLLLLSLLLDFRLDFLPFLLFFFDFLLFFDFFDFFSDLCFLARRLSESSDEVDGERACDFFLSAALSEKLEYIHHYNDELVY